MSASWHPVRDASERLRCKPGCGLHGVACKETERYGLVAKN